MSESSWLVIPLENRRRVDEEVLDVLRWKQETFYETCTSFDLLANPTLAVRGSLIEMPELAKSFIPETTPACASSAAAKTMD
jgi:hypothetical protein